MTTSEKEIIYESKSFDYVMNHPDEIGKHLGKWILLYDGKIVSTGEDLIKIHNEFTKKNPGAVPFVVKFPEHSVMLL